MIYAASARGTITLQTGKSQTLYMRVFIENGYLLPFLFNPVGGAISVPTGVDG